MVAGLKRYFLTGLFVLVPAWGTFLILQTLFVTVDGLLVDLLGEAANPEIPGLGVVGVFGLIFLTGVFATYFLGERLVRWTEEWVRRIPFVRAIYLILKGMTDLFNFRARFGQSAVVAFPFPRDGLWALGLVMGPAPAELHARLGPLIMVFVPTAIHPFTGYLAFIPTHKVVPINLPPEEAMKMEFSAGLYHPKSRWLTCVPRSDSDSQC